MWLLLKTAWRNLFRQRRRTLITVTAMAFSLVLAIPSWGLTEGLTREMLRGITRMELGHLQLHDPAYPRGKALQSTLRRPDRLLEVIRATQGVQAAAPRVHGYALASHDVKLTTVLAPLPETMARSTVLFGRLVDPKAPWRADRALACEALVDRTLAKRYALVVGTVLTPASARAGGRCERIRVVGLLKAVIPGVLPTNKLVVGLPAADLTKAFGRAPVETAAVLRHSATIQIVGVDPPQERRVTFMAEKVGQGSYLGPRAKSEIVVGYRLARVMRLKIGAKIFVQAASLDQTKGTFYQNFTVVGIYRTGVDMIDRSRVFIHVKDAQKVMSLGNRVHEIAVIGPDAKDPSGVLRRIKQRVATKLRITSVAAGKRAGSRPLPAPITVYEPRNGDTALIIPYDLKRRFDDLKGMDAVAKRVYATAEIATTRVVTLKVQPLPAEALQGRVPGSGSGACTIYPPRELAQKLGLKPGQVLLPWGALTGQDNGCARVTVGAAYAPQPAAQKRPAGAPPEESPVLSLQPVDQDNDEAAGLEAGVLKLAVPGPAKPLRLVGVEPSLERRISRVDRQLAAGRYLQGAKEHLQDTARWPALLPQRVVKRLGTQVGATLLLRTRDVEGKQGWRALELRGVIKDAAWNAELPELVLPYYSAQQVDAPRLNARAHEMLLLPKPGADRKQLALEARVRLAPLVRSWKQIAPDMAKLIKVQDTWTGILLFIIFLLAAMTVMNTMLMAVFERTREFGVMKSLGMRPSQVFWLIVLETLALALIAVSIGGAGGLALNHWAVVEGIDLSKWTGGFTYQGTFINPVWRAAHAVKVIVIPMVMVQAVCFFVSLYPALRASRLKPVQALRHHG
ncbi:MAG: FtsX-like permease family protein [bacterium]